MGAAAGGYWRWKDMWVPLAGLDLRACRNPAGASQLHLHLHGVDTVHEIKIEDAGQGLLRVLILT